MTDNVTWQKFRSREARWALLGQRPVIAWLTGLSGAGKTSLAQASDVALSTHGRHAMILDGDNLRHGLNCDLGFSDADRAENVRRTAEAARLIADTGTIVIVALISPSREGRAAARRIAGDVTFIEAFVDTPLTTCESRDPKGLYERARSGGIANFTGISAPYEPPLEPDVVLHTEGRSIEASSLPLTHMILQHSIYKFV